MTLSPTPAQPEKVMTDAAEFLDSLGLDWVGTGSSRAGESDRADAIKALAIKFAHYKSLSTPTLSDPELVAIKAAAEADELVVLKAQKALALIARVMEAERRNDMVTEALGWMPVQMGERLGLMASDADTTYWGADAWPAMVAYARAQEQALTQATAENAVLALAGQKLFAAVKEVTAIRDEPMNELIADGILFMAYTDYRLFMESLPASTTRLLAELRKERRTPGTVEVCSVCRDEVHERSNYACPFKSTPHPEGRAMCPVKDIFRPTTEAREQEGES